MGRGGAVWCEGRRGTGKGLKGEMVLGLYFCHVRRVYTAAGGGLGFVGRGGERGGERENDQAVDKGHEGRISVEDVGKRLWRGQGVEEDMGMNPQL